MAFITPLEPQDLHHALPSEPPVFTLIKPTVGKPLLAIYVCILIYICLVFVFQFKYIKKNILGAIHMTVTHAHHIRNFAKTNTPLLCMFYYD
jgi:hypothetical protein